MRSWLRAGRARQLGGFTAHRDKGERLRLCDGGRSVTLHPLLYSRAAASTRLRHYNVIGAHVVVTARGDSRPETETGGRASGAAPRRTRRRGLACLEEQNCLLARIKVAKVLLLVRCVRAEV